MNIRFDGRREEIFSEKIPVNMADLDLEAQPPAPLPRDNATTVTKASVTPEEVQFGRTISYVNQIVVGVIYGFIIIAIIMTWIYHFADLTTLVWISMFEALTVVCFVLSMFIIPLYWRWWTKKNNLQEYAHKHGLRMLLFYIIICAINAACVIGSLIWRIVLYVEGCTNSMIADECLLPQFTTVEISFIVIDCLSIAISVVGIVFGFLLRSNLMKLSTPFVPPKVDNSVNAGTKHVTIRTSNRGGHAGTHTTTNAPTAHQTTHYYTPSPPPQHVTTLSSALASANMHSRASGYQVVNFSQHDP